MTSRRARARPAAAHPATPGSAEAPAAPEVVTMPERLAAPGPADPPAPPFGDPEEATLLKGAVDEAARLLEADGGMIYLLDEASGELRFAFDSGITDRRRRAWVRRLRLPLGMGMFGRAAAERRVVSTADYMSDDAFPHTPAADRVVRVVGMRSMVVAPLIAGDELLGALGVFHGQPGVISEAEVALVRALADHAAAAIANRRLIADLATSRAALARRAEAERALREIAARISAIRTPEDLLQLVVDEAARLLAADGARIDLLDPETGALYWAYDALTGRRPGLGPIEGDGEAQAGEGISGRAVVERRAVYTGDYLADERFVHAPMPDAHARKHELRSVLAAPLLGGDAPLGTLTVYTSQVDAYGPEDATLIEALASQAGIAIRNAQLFEELARSREETAQRARTERALREIAASITAVRDPTEILHLIAAEAARILGHERVFINLLNDPTGATGWTWYSPSEVGRDDWPADEAIRVGEGVTGKAIAERRPFITGDYLADDRFVHRPGPDQYTAETGMHSTMAVPMFNGDEPLGAMLVEAPERNAFDEHDALVLDALAKQASIALANARLFEQLVRSREEVALRADSERTLRQIAARISAIRDPFELLQGLLGEAARLLWAERAQIDLVDPIGGVAQWVHPAGAEGSREPGGLPDRGIAGWAVEAGRGVWTGDYMRDRSFRHSRRADAFVKRAGLVSIVAAPLVGDSGLLGVIQVGTDRPGVYGPLDAELLEGLAAQAAIAITNARLIAELARSREEVARRAQAERTLREIAAEVTALRDPREVVQLVIRAASTLLGGDVAEIGLADDADPLYAFVGATSLPVDPEAPPPRVVPGIGVSGLAYQAGRVVLSGDYTKDDRFVHGEGVDEFLEEHGLRSAVSAPLTLEGRAFGAMTVISHRTDAFDEDDGALLQALADQAAIAVANARLITELERSQAELARRVETERALRDIAARITSLEDPEDVLDRIVEETRRLLGSDGAHLTLMGDDGAYLVPAVIAGASDEQTRDWMRTQQFPLDGGMNGLAAARGETVWTEDYLVEPRIPHEPDDQGVAERMGIRGMAVSPLRAPGGEIIGTLAVSYREPHPSTPDELELLQGLADHAAIAVGNSRLLERVAGSEARYRFMVDHSPDVVFTTDAEGRFTFLSESLERLLGWPAAEVVGSHFSVLIDDSSMPLAGDRWAMLVADPEVELRTRLILRHRDGSLVPFEVVATGIRHEGLFAGIHGSSRDISDRERLERELRDSEARYRYLVQASPDAIWQADANGRFTFFSETAEALFGRPVSWLVGRHFREIVAPESIDLAEAEWAHLAQDPDLVLRLSFVLVHADGTTFPTETSAVPIMVDGRFAGAHGSVRDLRERERMERERQRLERDLRRQAAELAASEERAHLARELHDSVTQALFSMTLVTRTLELLLQRDAGRALEQLEVLRGLQRDALAEMRSLIFELRPGSLEQDGLIHALRTHCAAVEGRVGLPITLEADDLETRMPIAVEDVLYRIAQEALHNVVKHAAARHVRVALARRRDEVLLSIVDDGQGFDPARVPPGHLGLTGMRARAERIGGRLRLTSAPGEGARIEVVVPLAADDPAAGLVSASAE